MKKYLLAFIVVMMLIGTNLLAEVIMEEDFETDGDGTRYTVLGGSNDGYSDYFVRTDGTFPSGLPNYTSKSGTWYFAAEDMDADISEDVVSLTFDDVDISGATGLNVSGLFASGGQDKFDSSDYMNVYVDIDNTSSWTLIGSFRNDGATYNTKLGLDSDLSGTNNGTFLTTEFTEYTFNIAGTGNLIDIKIEIVANSGSEEVAFDNIVLSYGETTPTVSTPTLNPGAGTYNDEVVVTISCATDGATIYYTTDGNDPTTASFVYSAPLTFTSDTTLKAFATKDGHDDSAIATAVYEVIDTSSIPTGMIISEYIDGSSSNKAVEIYNGTGGEVDLTPYSVQSANNGGDWGTSYEMTGTLAAGQVFVIGNASASSEIQAVTDATSGITFLNGNDAIGLFYNGVLIDVIGIQGVNPGTGWDVAGITEATADHTLVRKSTVTVGNTNWAASAGTSLEDSEWIVHDYDTFAYLGTHGEEPTPTVATPEISPIAGSYELEVEVTITCDTDGATIYYTTDGSDPTTGSTEYVGAFTLTEDTTVKAFAVLVDYTDSAIAQSAYIITEPVVGAEEPTVGTLFISEVSDAVAYQNEYIELYNNSDQLITLENVTLRMDLGTNFPLNNVSYVGDITVLPFNYMIITRGADQTAFETEFGVLPEGVSFLQGSTSMYFGTSSARRWQLVLITEAKAETIIDDTIQDVGGENNTSYQSSPGNWVTEPLANNTPGTGHGDQTLPVTLSSFMAVQTADNYAELTWVTHSESGIIGYDVLRSEVEDEELAIRVNSQIIQANNEATSNTYTFTDAETEMDATYYYWLRSSEFDGSSAMFGPVNIKIGQENDTPEIVIPTKTVLRNIYPNPFNPSTTVNFYMDEADDVKINVFNVKGQLINKITEDRFGEGFHNVVWNGKDLNGNDCSSGIYFFRMETKTENQMIKGILLK